MNFLLTRTRLRVIEVQSGTISRPDGQFESAGGACSGRLLPGRASYVVAAHRRRTGQLKALVWFWWIDETLSANLVYQSDHEIGSTFQVMKQMKIMT